jgi:hypothetical protein
MLARVAEEAEAETMSFLRAGLKLVPGAGLEPARLYRQGILSP